MFPADDPDAYKKISLDQAQLNKIDYIIKKAGARALSQRPIRLICARVFGLPLSCLVPVLIV